MNDYEQEFESDLNKRLTFKSKISEELERLIIKDDDRDDDPELEQFLDNLGKIEIKENKIKWIPPRGLDKAYREIFSQSVRELNKLLKKGKLTITKDGKIIPKEEG